MSQGLDRREDAMRDIEISMDGCSSANDDAVFDVVDDTFVS